MTASAMTASRRLALLHLALAAAAAVVGGLWGAPLRLLPDHGAIMVVFAALPALLGAIGYRLLPPMIGAPAMAMPRLGLAAFGLLVLGFVLLLLGAGRAAFGSGALGLLLLAADSVATILNMRAPGRRLHDLPPPVWGQLVASLLLVFSLPVLAGLATRHPALLVSGTEAGGTPGHLFWIAAQPLLAVMLVASLGLGSGIVQTLAGRRLAGGVLVPYALVALGTAVFMLWAHHLFVAGPAAGNTAYLALSTLVLAVVLCAILGSWLVTLARSDRHPWHEPALVWIMGFVVLCCAGGGGSVVMALHGLLARPADAATAANLLAMGRFHILLAACALCGFFGACGLWMVRPPAWVARVQAGTMLAGLLMLFLPIAMRGLAEAGSGLCALSVLIFGVSVVMSWASAAWRVPEAAVAAPAATAAPSRPVALPLS